MINIILGVNEKINEEVTGGLHNLAYFGIGMAIGVVLFLQVFLLFYLISSSKRKVSKFIKKDVVINKEYKNVILENQKLYKEVYKNAPIKEKVSGILKILYDMLEKISLLYYPKSDDSIFEISLDQLVDLLEYLTKRINFIIDSLLEGKLQIIDKFSKNSIKDKKLGFVYNFVFKKKDEKSEEEKLKEEQPKKKGLISKVVTKVANKVGGSLMNSEFDTLIHDLGEDINKLYSGQDLVFTDMTKKEAKKQQQLLKLFEHKKDMSKEEVEDD